MGLRTMATSTHNEYPDLHPYDPAKYERNVNLKWSLWSTSKGYWEERAPGVWDWMREWFDASLDDGNPESAGTADYPRILRTEPHKEIRYGTVEIQPGEAKVHFWALWDNGRTFHINEVIEAETFEELVHQIEHCEVQLIRECRYNRTERCIECGWPYQSKTSRWLLK